MQAGIFGDFSVWSERHGFPSRDTKTLFPFTLEKRSRVAAPWPDCFQFFTRAPSLPPRSAPNCKQTGYFNGCIAAGKDSKRCPKKAASDPRHSRNKAAKRRVTLAGPCPSCRLRRPGKRHASHAPASLQSKVSRSVPSPGHAPGDDETNFSQGVVPGACPV